MEVKKFYRLQREVASVIKEIVDQYWADKLTDKLLEENINIIYENNKGKIKCKKIALIRSKSVRDIVNFTRLKEKKMLRI